MKQWIKKIGTFFMILIVIGIIAVATQKQEYTYNADIWVYQEGIELAQEWCAIQNITPLSECADYLVEKQMDSWYFNKINGDAQKQLNRIMVSKNVSAILEANQTLSQIGNN